MICLGIDTSNYTSSAALYNSETGELLHKRRLLTVKKGEVGLRQSDAVFQHVKSMPEILEELFSGFSKAPDIISASVSPRDADGSYMPCFMCGKGIAQSLAAAYKKELFFFSHQAGHIAAALLSANRLDLINREFIAFHVSGGTTEAVLVEPCKEKIFSVRLIASSLDLKAGQAIDRVGAALGLPFPAGASLDSLSLQSSREFSAKPFMRGGSCSLSGLENICGKMLEKGEEKADIAKFCIDYISAALSSMTDSALEKYSGVPLVYSGGVMSNSIIRKRFFEKYAAVFAKPEFSSDNAAGIALLGALCGSREE